MNRRFTYSLNCLYDNSTLTGQLLQDNTYKYDNVGNIISIDDNGLNVRNQYFEYDNINRLTYSKGGMNCQGTGIGYETDYTYSAAGRILRKNVTSQRINTMAGLYPMDYQNNYTYPSTGNPFSISSVQDALSGSVNNLEWDANGNLIKSSCISGPAYDRRLCWTEDNRLQGYTEYSDENGDMSAWYNYNAGGDRNFKITSPGINIRQNAAGLRYSAQLRYPTLYASALITVNKGGYTKHYFEGTNRVCSKIGGGFRNVHWGNIEERVPTLVEDYDQLSEGQRESVERTFNECLNMGVEMDGIIDLYEVVSHESGRDDQEPAFFYHSDHLGSAAYLTSGGDVTQTLNYLPYGEDWIDVQNNMDPRLGQYRFNGKEKDYESGFHYYGARYYWSEVLTGWLSVDPMMDKYPSMSPYNYCAWDPVKLVDPDGREFCLNDDIVIKGANNSSVTIKTNIVDVSINIDYDFGGNYVLEGEEVLSAALDLVGIVDPSGVFDGANIVLQAKNGEWGYVALSAVGLIPYVGDIPKIGKIGKDIKILQKEIRSIKVNSIKPSGWIEKVSKKGDGKVYCDPNNAQNNIRIMTGNPNSPNPAQQVDYVKYQKNGVFYDVNGKPLVNGRCAEAHIPLSEYNSSVMPPF